MADKTLLVSCSDSVEVEGSFAGELLSESTVDVVSSGASEIGSSIGGSVLGLGKTGVFESTEDKGVVMTGTSLLTGSTVVVSTEVCVDENDSLKVVVIIPVGCGVVSVGTFEVDSVTLEGSADVCVVGISE